LKHYPHIVYEGKISYLKTQLESRVRWCMGNQQKPLLGSEFNLELYINGEQYHEGDELHIECANTGMMTSDGENICL
jgi:hypothetical protein